MKVRYLLNHFMVPEIIKPSLPPKKLLAIVLFNLYKIFTFSVCVFFFNYDILYRFYFGYYSQM